MAVDVGRLGQSEALTKAPNKPQSPRQSVHLPGFPALGPCTWGSENIHAHVMCWDCPSCWLDVVKMAANGACERQLCPGPTAVAVPGWGLRVDRPRSALLCPRKGRVQHHG